VKSRKIYDRGYWVAKLFYYQSLLYYYLNVIRFGSFTYFSAANPAMSYGGMLGDKKSDTYKILPSNLVPITIVTSNKENYKSELKKAGLVFPIFVKPDIGFKGFKVAKIEDEKMLDEFVRSYGEQSFLIQEFVAYQREYSILVYRYPKSGLHGVSSFIEKSYPVIIGDGKQSVGSLIDQHPNPFLKKTWIKKRHANKLNTILSQDEKLVIEEIGNYSRGAKFHSLNHLLNQDYNSWAGRFFDQVNGIDFCRIDLKADSPVTMLEGQYKIIEINGAKGEPLHTYDPKYGIFQIIKEVHKHWMNLKVIVQERQQMNYDFPSFKEGYQSWKVAKNLVK